MASTQISMTQAAGTSTKKFTVSMWFKPGAISTNRGLWGCGTGTGDAVSMHYQTGDTFSLETWDGSSNPKLQPIRKFRDPTAWYHLVFSIDTTNVTADDRLKIWVNGVRETGPYISNVTITQDSDIPGWSGSGDTMKIGNRILDGDAYFDGELSHVHVIDGTIYDASTFGETDSTSGIWKIKTSPTVTYGTNGCFIKMEDRTNLDLDSSPNAHTMTTAGTLTATYDNPSNNFATMNPLEFMNSTPTWANGNATYTQGGTSLYYPASGTMGLTAGKWYWEVQSTNGANNNSLLGIAGDASNTGNMVGSNNQVLGYTAQQWAYYGNNGNYRTNNGNVAYGSGFYGNVIIGVYLDLDNNKLYFASGGTIMESGTGIDITAASSTDAGYYVPASNYWGGSDTFQYNFGNGYLGTTAITSPQDDAGGIGAFKYDPSVGTFDSASKDFRAICTKNIKAYGG